MGSGKSKIFWFGGGGGAYVGLHFPREIIRIWANPLGHGEEVKAREEAVNWQRVEAGKV